MNKNLKKKVATGASTCLGVAFATTSIAASVSCSSPSDQEFLTPNIPTPSSDVKVYGQTNITTNQSTNLVLDLSAIKISNSREGFVVFEPTSLTNDKISFGLQNSQKAIAQVLASSDNEPQRTEAIQVNCIDSIKTPNVSYKIKATVYEYDPAKAALNQQISTMAVAIATNDIEIVFNYAKLELDNSILSPEGTLEKLAPGAEATIIFKAYNIDVQLEVNKKINVISSNDNVVQSSENVPIN